MRKREEIEHDFPRDFNFRSDERDGARRILEVLLDIRDLLSKSV